MEYDQIEFTLPPAPRGLCFDRNDFVRTNFSVDSFLCEHQNSLETIRDDLGVYLKVLRLAMIELINKDYANFVNLSATLIGFDKAIEKMQLPLGQLNEEVSAVKECLDDAMKELSMWLNQRNALRKKKQLLRFYSQTLNSLAVVNGILNSLHDKDKREKITLVDRCAMQYNHLKFAINKCESLVKPQEKKEFIQIRNKLYEILEDLLFNFWHESDEENLLSTLIILSSLDRVTETEELIRKKAVAPYLTDIINESSLQKSQNGLKGIYDNVLILLDSKLKFLLTAMEHSSLLELRSCGNGQWRDRSVALAGA
ncbi:Conserved oligomeric Golgi complex subunit 2 [Eumeta japonica]|uniref:Conserved oligomeric Golgi complex subunit 2 n=1 Tax=Eumeta variegata TaxID=151549 RepID=A0A4C1YIY7_EUMVA|nr:Conserved oligomeric Golgi complex subunit 2 [Eumeta japonica]